MIYLQQSCTTRNFWFDILFDILLYSWHFSFELYFETPLSSDYKVIIVLKKIFCFSMFLLQLLVSHGKHLPNFIITQWLWQRNNNKYTTAEKMERAGRFKQHLQRSNKNLKFCIGPNAILIQPFSNFGTKGKS